MRPVLKKGSQVYFEGKIQTRKWQDQSGQDRYSTEIVAYEMQMLGGRNGSGLGVVETDQPKQPEVAKEDDPFDDVPF